MTGLQKPFALKSQAVGACRAEAFTYCGNRSPQRHVSLWALQTLHNFFLSFTSFLFCRSSFSSPSLFDRPSLLSDSLILCFLSQFSKRKARVLKHNLFLKMHVFSGFDIVSMV